jgi:hypothetical protein
MQMIDALSDAAAMEQGHAHREMRTAQGRRVLFGLRGLQTLFGQALRSDCFAARHVNLPQPQQRSRALRMESAAQLAGALVNRLAFARSQSLD